jgi:hypothetical protein
LAGEPSADCDPLHADEIQRLELVPLDFEAEFDGFSNSGHEFVERPGLAMAAVKGRNRADLVPLGVALDDDVELAGHAAPLNFRRST